MEDNSLKINVTIGGQSFTTLKQLEDALKAEKKAIKDLDTASQEYTNRSKGWVEAEKEKARVSSVLVTEQGKLMKSYFATGEALRRTNPAFISFNQVIQDAPYGIRGVGNNIQFLTQQFTSLRASGMSTGTILKGMMGNILTPMGGLMLAVSAGTSLLTLAMDHLAPSTEKANDELEKSMQLFKDIVRLRFEAGLTSAGATLSILRMAEINAQYDLEQAKNPKDISQTVTIPADPEARRAARTETVIIKGKKATFDELQALEKKYLDARIERQNFEKASLKDENKEALEAERFSSDLQFEMQEKAKDDLIRMNKEYAKEKQTEEEFSDNLIYEMQEKAKDDLIKLDKEYADEKKKIAKDTIDAEADALRDSINLYNSVFFDPLKASFDAVANGSGNMADAFIASLKKMIVQLLEFAAFSLLLSWIPGMSNFGAIFGKLSGLSGVLPTQTEGKGTNRSDISRMSGSSSSRSSGLRVEVVGKLGNDAIYFAGNNYLALKSVSKI